MKLQHLAIIFIIIIVPISFVLSEYLRIHIQTIEYQTQYNTRLMNATHDASEAFQINTANNRYSTIGNSKIRDIEASIKTFYNTLGTSMGSSGYTANDLHDYTPAILCTLYDGYYIYTSYYDTELKNEDGTVGGYTYGLKPFISYSCRYKKGTNDDFVVNYTLDNTITIIGTVNGKYVTKTGHLINVNGAEELKNSFSRENLTENLIILNDNGTYNKDSFSYIIYNNQKVYKENEKKYFYYSTEYKKDYVTTLGDIDAIGKKFSNGGSSSAIDYYNSAIEFTNWVNINLKGISAEDAVDASGIKITDFATDLGNAKIFDTTKDNDPLLSSSVFNEHRMNVIRKSIETNLVPAIANYNRYSQTGYEFTMPKLSEDEWYKIENNVCFVSFLQGMPIKSKTYNNYCVISNNTNLETVGEDSIYIEDNKGEDNKGEYHKPGCKKLIAGLADGTISIKGAYPASDFLRKSVALTGEDANAAKQLTGTDSNATAFFFPQADTACYDCIVNASDAYSTDDIIKGKIEIKDDDGNVTKTIPVPDNLRKAYLQALARARYDLYTVNGYFGS